MQNVTTERLMVKAHQDGMRAFACNGSNVSLEHVVRHAREHYRTDQERDSFVAGYIGAMRRASNPGTL